MWNRCTRHFTQARLALVVKACSTHTVQRKYTCLKHNRVFLGLRCNFFPSNHYVLPTSITYRSEWCAQFINVQRSPHRKQLQTALFPKRLSHDTGRTVFFLFFDGEINLIPAVLSVFSRPGDGFFVAVNGGSIHPDRRPRIPSPSVRLLSRENADWWIIFLRKTQLWRDWIRLGWCIHRLLVIFSILVPTQ